VKRYRDLLGRPEFRRLWIGSTASALGDGSTWIALSWLIYERTHSSARVGLLVFVYGAPVLLGGVAIGPLLDRFGAVRMMRLDGLFRGCVMASIPIAASFQEVPLWALYTVATSYGLLKMIPLAGVPTLIPTLVRSDQLHTANAMESLSYSLSGVVAPMFAGALIAAFSAADVLALDAASFFFFAACLRGVPDNRRVLEGDGAPYSLREAVRFAKASGPITLTTIMFASFNMGIGALLVVLPIYTATILGGGATLYAALTSALLTGDLIGSFTVGAMAWRWPLGRSIAVAQAAVGISLLPMLVKPAALPTLALLFISGVLTSPLTIWAQTLRMRLIPPELRGRIFNLLRTTMQAAEPIGRALGGAVIATGGLVLALAGIATAVGAPGLVGIAHPALATTDDATATSARTDPIR
jgi:MFS family permease